MIVRMQLRPLGLAVLLFAAGMALTRALITHDGVGVIEYAVSAAILGLLLVTAFRLSRRAIGRG
jgi:Flp pilus assembly pilin Flp